jgi:tight adherence protein C
MTLSFFYLLLERDFLVVALSAIAAFATIVTLGLPYMKKDALEGRMKAVAERRDELRQKQREAFAQSGRKGQLRSTPVGFMKQTLDNLKLEKLLESPGMKRRQR